MSEHQETEKTSETNFACAVFTELLVEYSEGNTCTSQTVGSSMLVALKVTNLCLELLGENTRHEMLNHFIGRLIEENRRKKNQ